MFLFFLLLRVVFASEESTTETPFSFCIPPTTTSLLATEEDASNNLNFIWKQGQSAEHNEHLCFLNYPKNDYCKQWRVIPLIVLTDQSKVAANTAAIQQFLRKVNEHCKKDSYLMPFLPSNPNPSCSTYQFGGNYTSWLENLTPQKTLIAPGKDPGDVFESLVISLYHCAQLDLSSDTAGAIFIFSDLMCEPLCSHLTFGDTVNSMIFNVTMTRYTTTSIFLGEYSDFEQSCLSVIFLFCAYLYNKQICDVSFFSDLNNFTSSANNLHTCAVNSDKLTTSLVLEIVLPSLVGILIIMVILIVIIRSRSRRKWFKFWQWEHKGSISLERRKEGRKSSLNEYYDTLGQQRDLWEIYPKNLDVQEEDFLGHGAFAVVYKGHMTGTIPLLNVTASPQIEGEIPGGYEVAVKRLPNHADDQARSDFLKELDFMKHLGYHSHVISLLGCISNPIDPMIVVEYCFHGDLLHFLRKNKNGFLPDGYIQQPVADAQRIMVKDLLSFSWQICDGMVYLSSHNFIHRDLAARNILLTKKLVAKIGDFGLCREVDSALYTTQGGRLPIKWMALESLKFYEYTTKSDVWSYSVLLYEIFSFGEGPFQGVQPMEMALHLEQGNRLEKPANCPEEIYKIMEKCWSKQPENRPCFQEIRQELGSMLTERDSHYGYLSLDPRYSCEEEYLDEAVEI